MKRLRDKTGKFPVRLWFDEGEIDQLLEDELAKAGLMPTATAPAVDVEAFVEQHLGLNVAPLPDNVSESVLGAIEFESGRPIGIFVRRDLLDEASQDRLAERRLRSTLAHEGGGHAVLHPPLFEVSSQIEMLSCNAPRRRHLCRGIDPIPGSASGYSGEWWEYQANQAIGALLMPRTLFMQVLDSQISSWGRERLHRPEIRVKVERMLSKAFNVSKEAVHYRIDNLGIVPEEGQEVLQNRS